MKLIDVCELIVDCPHSTAKDEGEGIPLVRTPNIGKGRLELSGVHRVSEAVYNQRIERAVPKTGDLILAREAPVGNVALIMPGQKVCLGQRVVLIRPDKVKADPAYLTYYLLSEEVQHRLKSNANGAVVAHLNMNEIRNLVIDLPEISIQKRIATVLSSIDDKIALNNRINHNLEEQAQALYKSWFVDFEPFNGHVPDSWEIGVLSDILSLRRETIRKDQVSDLPYLPIDLIPMHSFTIDSFADNSEAQSSLQVFSRNDILIGAMRVYFHRVVPAPCHGITRNTCFVLRPVTTNLFGYALMICNQDSTIAYAQRTSKGSTMPYAVWDGALANMNVIIPDENTVKRFNGVIKNIIEKIQNNSANNFRLRSLRDSLLPKLMSGELSLIS